MKTTMKIFATFILIFSVSLFINSNKLSAQDEATKAMFTELKTNIDSYLKTNVIPQLTTWKQQLDGAMTQEDLTTLNSLRTQAKELRTNFRTNAKNEFRGKRQDGEKPDKKQFKEDMKEHKNAMKNIMEQLKPLAERYKETLVSIADESKPLIGGWKDDIMEIVTSWKDKYEQELDSLKDKNDKRKHFRGFRNDFIREFKLSGKRAVARFMLWDGSEDIIDEGRTEFLDAGNSFGTKGEYNLKSYPNPTQNSSKIDFILSKTEFVNLTVSNTNGEIVATLCNEVLQPGEYSYNFDYSKISNGSSTGTYFYRLKTGSKTETGKMILTR